MAGKDLLTEDKEAIKEEADDAFNAEDMVDSLERELGEEVDDRLGDGEPSDDDEEIADGLNDDDTPADDAVDGEAVDDAETEQPGADRGDGRDNKGRFASQAEQDAADKASADAKKAGKTPEEQKAAGTAAAAAAKPAADKVETAQPKWEPYQVRADKALHPMGAARTMRTKDAAGNEHVLIAVPSKEYQQFEHRIGRGIAAERQWREITETRRELELQKTAPKPKSDAEIEAAMFVEALSKMPGSEEGVSVLDEIFTPEQLENLKLKVQLAQAKEKTDFTAAEARRREESTAGETWQREQTDTLVNQAFDLVENHPELKGMTEDEVKEVLQELAMPVKDKLIYRENGEVYANTEYLFKLLKRGRSAPPAPAPTNASAAPVVPDKKVASAERFNNGQESAAQPRSTSLKNNRAARPQPNGRTPRDANAPKDDRTPQQKAEDDMRKTRRSMMRTDTLDFD